MAEKHLVLICPEPTRALQQGIGIRFLEMARELRRLGRVSLWVPNEDYPTDYDFEVRRLPKGDLPDAIGGVDAVVIHGHVSDWYFNALRRHQLGEGPPLVVDLYDPFLIENLQYCEELGEQIYWRDRGVLLRQLERGDFFLASSDTQRLFYLGMMIGHGHFALHEYQQDHTLRRLIDVAPFGVRPIAVDAAGTVAGRIKGVVDGIGHADQVLFFGGIYDWYDPELLLDVLDRVIAAAPRLRVIFSSNPNPDTTPQGVFKRVKERSDAAGWTGKYVFFLPWFPYDQRLRYFRDVDLAVSLHRASVETELSLRTRILEYMNMGIPVISTEGGESARLLMTSGGGILVKEGDRAGLAMALVRLLSDEPERRTMGERGRRYAAEWLCWHQTLAPLLRFCDSPRRAARAPAAQPSRPDVGTLYSLLAQHGHAQIVRRGAATSVCPEITLSALRFSVVIPNFNGKHYLGECLDSLAAVDYPRNTVEWIVVDNGSRDGSVELLREHYPWVTVVPLAENTGFVGGINAGVAAAQGKYLVFLNKDMRVTPQWLAAFDAALSDTGSVCAAGMIVSWDGKRIDFVEGVLTFDGHALQRHQGAATATFPTPVVERTFIACGGNMAVERESYLALGGFDEAFFAYTEDVDFSWRLHATGHAIHFCPQALVYHHHQGTSTALGVYRRGYLFERNAFMTLYKNVDAPLFDTLVHLAWTTLLHRTREIVALNVSGSEMLGIDPYRQPSTADGPAAATPGSDTPGALALFTRYRRQFGTRAAIGRVLFRLAKRLDLSLPRQPEPRAEALDFSHPYVVSQLQAIWYVLANLDRLQQKRAAVQRLRKTPDRAIFEQFTPWVVATYPGDDRLFASDYFRSLLPAEIPFRFATINEIHG